MQRYNHFQQLTGHWGVQLLKSGTEGRALVIGASGQVGRQLCSLYSSDVAAFKVLATSRQGGKDLISLDLATIGSKADVDHVLRGYDLNSIFCIGGMTNVEACENDREGAFQVNARAPRAFAEFAWIRRIPVIYFSTEYVFSGRPESSGPYQVDDSPCPINVYGHSKLAGEHYVLDSHPEALVIRTTVVYGLDPGGRNYLYGVLRNLSQGKPMQVPEDQISTPTYNVDLARLTDTLVREGASGIFHVCGAERMSRYQFAMQIACSFNLDPTLLLPVATSSLGQRASRPLSAGLSTSKLASLYPNLRTSTLAVALSEVRPDLEATLAAFTVEQKDRPSL